MVGHFASCHSDFGFSGSRSDATGLPGGPLRWPLPGGKQKAPRGKPVALRWLRGWCGWCCSGKQKAPRGKPVAFFRPQATLVGQRHFLRIVPCFQVSIKSLPHRHKAGHKAGWGRDFIGRLP